VVPSEDYSHGPPIGAGFSDEGDGRNEQAEHKKKTMKTTSKISKKAQGQTEQSSTQNSLPRISFKHRRRNRALPVERLLKLLRSTAPRFWDVAEVVGKWVWITFTEKQPREVTMTLSELGFHWNNIRQCWQHPCGTSSERTPRDPRNKYGSYFAADMELI
jgi:hypothetical protein